LQRQLLKVLKKEIRLQVIDWQIIIEKHGAIVWKTAYRLLGNYTDTSDCFQETFVSALKVSSNQKIKNFPAFLARLATTRAIDMLRMRFRHEANNSTIDCSQTTANDYSDPVNYVQNQELATNLQKALVQLPVQEAQVFCLRYLNDMSYHKIAKELDLKTNAVGVLLHRAKEKLRKTFEESPDKMKSEVVP
jgi:RNA polymerase sigma-70 factor (ECF subfamily)